MQYQKKRKENQQKIGMIRRLSIIKETIKEKLDTSLCRNGISFTLPGRNNQVLVNVGKMRREKVCSNKKSICYGHSVNNMEL